MQNLNFHPHRHTRTTNNKDTFINVKSIISSVKVREIIQSQSKPKFNSPQNQMLTKFHSNKLFFEHKSNSNNNHIKPTPTSINITPKHMSSVISNSNSSSNYNLQFSNSSKLNNKVIQDNNHIKHQHKIHNHFSTQKLAPNKLLNILADNKHHKLHKKHHNSNSNNNFLLSPLKKLLKSPDKQTINNSTNITSKKLSKTHPTNINIEIENNNKYKDEYQYKQTHNNNNSNSNNNSHCNNVNNNTRQLSTQNKVITTSRQKTHSLSQAPLYKSPQTRKTKPNSNLVINTQQSNSTRMNAMNTMTTRHNNIINNSKEKKYIYTVNLLTNSNRNHNARSISNTHNNKKQSVNNRHTNSQKKLTNNFIKKYSTELNTKTNSFSEKHININNHNHSYDNSNTKHNIKYPNTNLLSQSKTQTKMQIKVNRRPRNYFHNSSISNTLRSNSNYSSLQRHKKSISLSKHVNSKSITVTKDKPRTYLTIKEFIIKYHKYLTLPEVTELKHLPQSTYIYYTNIFEQRKKNKSYSYTNMNNSFTSLTSPQFKLKQHNNIKQQRLLRNRTEQTHLPTLYHFNKEIDDSDGDYIITQGEHINYRYEIICLLGKGSYGEAIKCYDHKTKEYVCVKIIKSNIKFYDQAKIEIQILDYISRNDTNSFSNIVKFYTHFTFRNHICLVFELLDINLFEYLQHNDFNGIHINKIRSYTTEILFALLFLHKHRIIHCDLKPENILLLKHKTSNVKVIDFGSSCFDKNKMYSYIQSRFYRAPEVILELGYSLQIDIWSLGCIICELYTGYPIFPGENEKEQLSYIMEYFDVPPKEMIESSPKMEMFFDKTGAPLRTPNSNGKVRMPLTKTLKRFLGTNNEVFIDFMCGCLKWLPLERFTPQQALNHRFIIDGMKPEVLNMHSMKIEKILNGNYDGVGKGKEKGKGKGKARTGRISNYSISKSKREMSSRYSARYDPRRNSLSPSERVNNNVKGDKKKKS